MGILSSLLGIGEQRTTSVPTAVTEPTIAKEIAPFLSDILKKGQALYKTRTEEGFQPFTGQTIADLTPEQLQAREAIKAQVGTQAPVIEESKGLIRGTTEAPTAEALQPFMNPFQQAVTDISKRQAQEKFEQETLPALRKQAVDAGAFGGSRAAMRESQAQDLQDRLLADIQAKGDLAAFQNAQQQFAAQKAREAAAASGLSTLAGEGFGAGLREAAALQTIGEEDQRRAQMALDEQYKQFLQEKQFPETELAKYQAIVGGFPIPAGSITTSTPPPQPSTLERLAGVGLAGANIYGKFGGFSPGGLGSGYFGAQGGQVIPSKSGGLVDLPVVQKDIGGQTIEDRRTRGERIRDFIARNIFSGPQASEKLKAILAGKDISNMSLTEEGPIGIAGPDGYGVEVGRDGNVEKVSIPNLEYADDNIMYSTKEQLDMAKEAAAKKKRGFDSTAARSKEVAPANIMSVDKFSDNLLKALEENYIKSGAMTNKTAAGPALEQVQEEIQERKRVDPLEDERFRRIFTPTITGEKTQQDAIEPGQAGTGTGDGTGDGTGGIGDTGKGLFDTATVDTDSANIRSFLDDLTASDKTIEDLQKQLQTARGTRVEKLKSQYRQDLINTTTGAAAKALLGGEGFSGALTAISDKLDTVENPQEKIATIEESGIIQDIQNVKDNSQRKLSRLLAKKQISDSDFNRGVKIIEVDAKIKQNLLTAQLAGLSASDAAISTMSELLKRSGEMGMGIVSTVYYNTLKDRISSPEVQKEFEALLTDLTEGTKPGDNKLNTFPRKKNRND